MHAAFAPSTAAAVAAMAAAIAREDTDGAWLQLKGVGKRFGAMTALDEVSLDIRAGEIHCLLGENGAGKSTLCNLVFGVHAPDSGTMLLDGAPLPAQGPGRCAAPRHRHGAPAFQPGRGPDRRRQPAAGAGARAAAGGARQPSASARWSRSTGWNWTRTRAIADLSVGERQRVEIVKCLMREPRLLVLDEPTAVLLPDEIAGAAGGMPARRRQRLQRGAGDPQAGRDQAGGRPRDRAARRPHRGDARPRRPRTSTAWCAAMIARDGAAPPQGQRQQAPRPPRLPSNDLRDEVLQVDGLTVTRCARRAAAGQLHAGGQPRRDRRHRRRRGQWPERAGGRAVGHDQAVGRTLLRRRQGAQRQHAAGHHRAPASASCPRTGTRWAA